MARKKASIENARELSSKLIAKINPEYTRTITIHEQIADVCERLVSALPPIEPTHETVSEQGGILYPRFVAKQTISNWYSDVVRIWSNAFFEIGRVSIQEIKLEFDSDENTSGGVNGHAEEIRVYRAVIKRQLNQIKHLQHVAGNMSVPVSPIIIQDEHAIPNSETPGVELVKEWLQKLKSGQGSLKLTDAGIEISQTARPGRIVMDLDTWHVMLELTKLE